MIGEGSLENAADELSLSDPERQVVLTTGKLQRSVVFEALQLLQRLARHQHTIASRRPSVFDLDQGHPMPIGRHQLERSVLDQQQRTIELKTRLFRRYREEDFRDHASELRKRDLQAIIRTGLGKGRKVLGRQAVKLEARLIRVDREDLRILLHQPHLFSRQRAHDLEQLARLYCDSSTLDYFSVA